MALQPGTAPALPLHSTDTARPVPSPPPLLAGPHVEPLRWPLRRILEALGARAVTDHEAEAEVGSGADAALS